MPFGSLTLLQFCPPNCKGHDLHLAQALQALEALQVQAPQTLAPQALPGIPPGTTNENKFHVELKLNS